MALRLDSMLIYINDPYDFTNRMADLAGETMNADALILQKFSGALPDWTVKRSLARTGARFRFHPNYATKVLCRYSAPGPIALNVPTYGSYCAMVIRRFDGEVVFVQYFEQPSR